NTGVTERVEHAPEIVRGKIDGKIGNVAARLAGPVAARAHFHVFRMRGDLLEMRAARDRITLHHGRAEARIAQSEIADADVQRRHAGRILPGHRAGFGVANIRPVDAVELRGDATLAEIDQRNFHLASDIGPVKTQIEFAFGWLQGELRSTEITIPCAQILRVQVDTGDYSLAAPTRVGDREIHPAGKIEQRRAAADVETGRRQ